MCVWVVSGMCGVMPKVHGSCFIMPYLGAFHLGSLFQLLSFFPSENCHSALFFCSLYEYISTFN